jgi:hypothetical protein
MNTTDPQGDLLQPRSNNPANVDDLVADHRQLVALFNVAMAAVVIMAVFIFLFMFKQYRMVKAQVDEQRPTIQKMYVDYQKTTEPLVRNFTASLQAYSAKNRDFQPILDKYRDALRPYFPGGPASTGTGTAGK